MPDSPLAYVEQTFDRWLYLENKRPVYAMLGAVAANYLPGDPVWLGIIAPPSSAKTEMLNSLSKLKQVFPVGTITPAGLLSGTATKDRKNGAKGGLLREVDKFGILVLKDYGSILTLRPDTKAEVIAALREIYDGKWTRVLGTEGGRSFTWAGKCGMVFGATQAFDRSTAVGEGLGDRNMLCRLDSGSPGHQFDMAMKHVGGAANAMRDELSNAVKLLFDVPFAEVPDFSDYELNQLRSIISKVVRLRAPVVRDWRTTEITSVDDPEGPARLTIALAQLRGGLMAIGINHEIAFDIIAKIAFDTAPPLRVRAYSLLSPNKITTRDVALKMELPTSTVRRVLEDLMCQGLAARQRETDWDGSEKQGGADLWTIRYPDDNL